MHKVHYVINPIDPAAHIFQVSCRIQQPDPRGQELSMPAWIPGSYMIRDFAKNIINISAQSGSDEVPLRKLGKDRWQCGPCDGPLLIEYQVYAWDLSVRTAHLDTTHGFFNGSSVFLKVHGEEQNPCSVDIQPPVGKWAKQWRVATAMPRLKSKPYKFGLYAADNYDELIDHPVEMGEFTLAEFKACGVPHAVVITGRHQCDTERLCADLQRLCEYHIRFFGEPAPMDNYLFLVMAVGEGYGGLEHRASTSLLCSRETLPLRGQSDISTQYREFLGLCSHEYFHSWNIKRIKPASFTPYDLQRENYTKLLWAFEGITSYYDDLALLRSGLISTDSYLQLLGQTITRVMRGQGRFQQTVADSSYYAWTKFYKQDENAANAIVSYYTKGALVALCLDMLIRDKTKNHYSLDDLMRDLWVGFGKTGAGVPEAAIEKIATQIAGEDLTPFFDKALRSTEDLDLTAGLNILGIKLHSRAQHSQKDKGGKPAPTKKPAPVSMGVRFQAHDAYPKLQIVYADGAAHKSGLAAGDVIIAINGLKATAAGFENMLSRYTAGDVLDVHAFRRDELMEFKVELQPPLQNTYYLELDSQADAEQMQLRAAWLGTA